MHIKIYSKTPCPYCDMAEREAKKLTEHTYEKLMLNKDFTMEELLELQPNARTFPQIFVDDNNIGGYDQFKKQLDEKKL
mgnify:CR=1 FL=1|jgi:glutaredoxin